MAPKDKPRPEKTITVKKTITVRAIVTRGFQDYLRSEVISSMELSEKRFGEIQTKAKEILESDKTPEAGIREVQSKLDEETAKYNEAMEQLVQMRKQIDTLKMDSLFDQATIDGYVTLRIGDNLYEKLTGEIIVRDGSIIDIK